ncbi:MAG: hypothetical protein LH471_08925, partial [Salinibacterium sp.]|nr:hypothetical protein [Salinibacterium sp.]
PTGALDRWQRVARALPLLTLQPLGDFVEAIASVDALVGRAATYLADGLVVPAAMPQAWQLAHDDTIMLSRNGVGNVADVALMLDDRDLAVSGSSFADSWRLWLRLSNLLGVRDVSDSAEILTFSEAAEFSPRPMPVDVTTHASITVEWQEALDLAEDGEKALLLELSGVADIVVPSIGIEVADGIPVGIGWEPQRVAVDTLLPPGDVHDLRQAGWTVVAAELSAIVAAMKSGK